jgi:hypothetical protein
MYDLWRTRTAGTGLSAALVLAERVPMLIAEIDRLRFTPAGYTRIVDDEATHAPGYYEVDRNRPISG